MGRDGFSVLFLGAVSGSVWSIGIRNLTVHVEPNNGLDESKKNASSRNG